MGLRPQGMGEGPRHLVRQSPIQAASTVAEIKHRAKWLSKEMEAVGEALAQAASGEWGSDPREMGLDLQDKASELLRCINQPTESKE